MKPNGAWSNASQTAAPMPAESPPPVVSLLGSAHASEREPGGIRVRLSELQRDACPLG